MVPVVHAVRLTVAGEVGTCGSELGADASGAGVRASSGWLLSVEKVELLLEAGLMRAR